MSDDDYEFYNTPEWVTQQLVHIIRRCELDTRPWRIVDAGAGNGAITKVLAATTWRTAPSLHAVELHPDRVKTLRNLNVARITAGDWTQYQIRADVAVMNPPFSQTLDWLQHALILAPHVFCLTRTNWLLDGEARHGRVTWLRRHPPDVYALPARPKFVNDRCDNQTYCWIHIQRDRPAGKPGTFQYLDGPNT